MESCVTGGIMLTVMQRNMWISTLNQPKSSGLLPWTGLDWLDRAGLGWIRLDRSALALGWTRLASAELRWTGIDWDGLGWTGMD